jgi:pimeloyl-ACP methyl ester carboxylesterase
MSVVGPVPLPPGTRRRLVDVPGGPLAVLETGDGGPTVVLVPGFTGSKEDFRLLLGPLAAHGRRVVAVDQRGQYESPGPDDADAYSVKALAGDLLALLEALDAGPVHLVGHSFGGLVSRAAVLERPESVRSLTLMCSGPEALTGPRTALLPLLAPVLEQGGTTGLADALEALAAEDPRTLAVSPEVRAFLRTRMVASSAAGLIGMAAGLTGEPDRVAELAASGVPVLVLYGEADDAWAPVVQADMARRLGAAHVVVPGAMHSPAVESPGPTAEALSRFFDGVERG